jgi:hypothetical protein
LFGRSPFTPVRSSRTKEPLVLYSLRTHKPPPQVYYFRKRRDLKGRGRKPLVFVSGIGIGESASAGIRDTLAGS